MSHELTQQIIAAVDPLLAAHRWPQANDAVDEILGPLLAELVRLRAEHDRCEVLADRWSRYSASEYSSSDAPQAVRECARLLAAALIPVQHPAEEDESERGLLRALLRPSVGAALADEHLWAMDLDENEDWPLQAHLIVDPPGVPEWGAWPVELTSACGEKFTAVNHRRGWQGTRGDGLPMAEHAIHCGLDVIRA